MEQNKTDAVNYGIESNKLENNILTDQEVEKVYEGINVTDEEFIKSVIDMIDNGKEESEDVKIKDGPTRI